MSDENIKKNVREFYNRVGWHNGAIYYDLTIIILGEAFHLIDNNIITI